MRLKTAIMAILLLCTACTADCREGLGVGMIVGEPTGVSIKTWLSKERAIDAAAAWSFSENDSFQFHADYLIHNFELIPSDKVKGTIPVYFGIGGRIKLEEKNKGKGRNDDDTLFGVRFPLGISFLFADVPFDVFAEIVPVLDLVPDTEVDINAAIGVRFYF